MKHLSAIACALLAVAALHSCLTTVPNPGICAVTVTVDARRTASLAVEPMTLGRKLALLAARWPRSGEAFAYIPSIIENIRVTVSAGDMETVMATENVAGLDSASIAIAVPVGLARNFLVEGLTAANDVAWNGQVSVDLTGAALTIPITMTPGAVTVPQVLSADPPDGATGVKLRTAVTATFSEAMDGRTITDSVFTVVRTATGLTVSGSVSATAAAATFAPAADLLPNEDYMVRISTEARSAYGIPMAQDEVWLFRTVPTVPYVIATSPGNGETGVAVNAVLTTAFSEDMDPATINGTTFLLSGTTGTVTYDGASRVATYVTSPLVSTTTYTATITMGARSALGLPLARDHVWSFATGTTVDAAPPVFAGLESVANRSLTSMELSWTAATDDMTPQSAIVYLVYQATASGGQNFSSPSYQTAPGAVSYEVAGLVPGVTYYFVVRARDEAGNIDGNVVERFAAYPGLFVDVAIGSDLTGDGSPENPFKTITRALSATSGSLPIYVAAGAYDLAAGEVFPLQLRPSTALLCRGAGQGTVIDATGSGEDAVYGNEGAAIEDCKIVPESGRAGIDDRIGGTNGAPGRIVVSGSVIDGPAADAVLFSANSSFVTSTITGTTGRGIMIIGGRPAINGSTIWGKQVGIEVAADTDPSIDGNILEGNGIAVVVTAAGGRPSVRNNTIANNVIGIHVTAGAPLIHKNEVKTNTIAGNDVGIEIAGGMPTVSFNTVTDNITGIDVTGGTPSIKSNSIFCNRTVDLHVGVDNQIDAKINSWDHGPPMVGLSPCVRGTDICYVNDPAGVPLYDPYSSPPPGACP